MDIVSVLDKTFFMGDGRALLRGVSKQIGEPVGTLGAPGGTRMFVFFPPVALEEFQAGRHRYACKTGLEAAKAWSSKSEKFDGRRSPFDRRELCGVPIFLGKLHAGRLRSFF